MSTEQQPRAVWNVQWVNSYPFTEFSQTFTQYTNKISILGENKS